VHGQAAVVSTPGRRPSPRDYGHSRLIWHNRRLAREARPDSGIPPVIAELQREIEE
jgi:hypothetical protein